MATSNAMSTNNSNIKYKIIVTQNQRDFANNASSVTVQVKCYRTNTGYSTYGTGTVYCIIDGTTYTSAITSSNKIDNAGVILFSKTLNIPHNSSGAKTLKCEAKIEHSQFTSSYQSFSTALVSIPQYTTISCVNGNIGSKVSIKLNRKSTTAFKHNISYALYDYNTYQFISGAAGSVATGINAATYSWTIPTSFYAKIPNDKKVRCELTVETLYNGNTVGMSSCEIVCTAAEADCKPTLSLTVTDTNTAASALTNSNSIFIKGVSNASYTATAKARNSATLKSLKITNGSITKTAATGVFNKVSNGTFTAVATDSRGYTTTVKITKTLINYVNLSCSLLGRMDVTGLITLTIRGYYYNGSFGATNNTLTLQYREKESGGSFGNWTELLSEEAKGGGNAYSIIQEATGYDYDKTYVFQVRAIDKLKTVTTSEIVVTCLPIFDWGKNDFRVNGNFFVTGNYIAGALLGLGRCPILEEGTNLNNCKTPGVYGIPSNALGESLVNCPYKGAGRLIVYSANGGDITTSSWVYLMQELHPYIPSQGVYKRAITINGDGVAVFGDWYQHAAPTKV